ncbi:zinc-ribbon domain-containing protein [Tautonia rosea]|uniref:zinc-ribbon domain-containing protein n=1 Tax=Tautonia rosea TaxID=2728037 RepID=UPI0014731741|nr:zinc-ribbon domain-containing protein [Tautonia rosea]
MRLASRDWDDDSEDWDEDPDDWDDDDESAVLPCPSCGAEVYEDAEQCPHCGEFIVRRLRVWEGRPWWWVAMGLLGIGAMIWALI